MDLENVLLSDLEANERHSALSVTIHVTVCYSKTRIHQRAEAMFKDDRMWDVMVTHKAGAVQSTSHPICILSNLTQRGSVREISNRGGDRDIVKQMNAAFRKAALTDGDEGKHFTSCRSLQRHCYAKKGIDGEKGK